MNPESYTKGYKNGLIKEHNNPYKFNSPEWCNYQIGYNDALNDFETGIKLQSVLCEYELDDMLDTLNDKCGNGKPLTLNEKQAIRFMVEELNRVMKGIV